MVVHPAPGNYSGTLVNSLLGRYELSNDKIRPDIVHRLDKDTSGLMLVAKNDWAHDKLSKMIKDKSVKRIYLALVDGVINHDTGTYLQNGNNTTKDLYETLANQGLLFDLSILLYCNRDERLNGLRKKSNNDKYLMNESLSTIDYDETFKFVKEHPNNNILVIDTTNITMDEVFEIAKQEIEKLKSNKVLRK